MTLHHQAITGIKWTAIAAVIMTILQLAQMAVLARFLSPDDFGLMAVSMIVYGFAYMFMDMGVSNAIIYSQNVTHRQLSSLYWLNVFCGVVTGAIVAAIAPVIADFYNENRLRTLLPVISLVFVIVSLGTQFRILCQKEMQFETMAKIDMFSTVASFSVAVICAINGLGVWSLVYALLMQSILQTLQFMTVGLKHHKPSFVYDHKDIKSFLGFGLYQMGENAVNFLNTNIDKILIGRMLGLPALGFYNLAWQLIIFPVQKINPVVGKVAFPLYSQLQDNKELLSKYFAFSIRGLSLITVPILAFLFFNAYDVVRILYGEKWDLSADLIRILALIGLLRAIANPGGALILSKGRADVGFWWNLFLLICTSVTLYVTLRMGGDITTVATAQAVLALSVSCIWHYLVARFGGVHYLPIALQLVKIVSVSLAICGAGYAVARYSGLDNSIMRLAVASAVCAALYGPYIYLFEKQFLNALLNKKQLV